jgi:hypothetical protein
MLLVLLLLIPARLEKSRHFNHFPAGRQFIEGDQLNIPSRKRPHLLILARWQEKIAIH